MARVRAACGFVHGPPSFGDHHARATRTAVQAIAEGHGVCRDFAHLAIAPCRRLDIPARCCTGCVSDVGGPPPHEPMDFATRTEVRPDGPCWVFDPRNNAPRIGRIPVARGGDAADMLLTRAFGTHPMMGFEVRTEPASEDGKRAPQPPSDMEAGRRRGPSDAVVGARQ